MSKIEYRGTLVCSINVSDLDRSVRWYRDGLGFEEIYRMEDYGWCEMRSPIDGVVEELAVPQGSAILTDRIGHLPARQSLPLA